jgi:hypothetical protein
VTVNLDRFGQDALMQYLRGTGGSRDVALHAAVRYYLGDPESDRVARRVPRLARQVETADGIEFDVQEDLYSELEREARRQEVTPDQLATHALLYFLADLDTGRAAARLGDAIHDRDAEAD